MKAGNIPRAAVAAAVVLLSGAPASAGFFADLKQGWQDFLASFGKTPEKAEKDVQETLQKAGKEAEKAAQKGKAAAGKAVQDAKKSWQEFKDAVQDPDS